MRVTPKARTSSRLLPLLGASVAAGVLLMALQARSIAANGYDWPLSVFHTAVADTDSVAVDEAIGDLLDAAQDSTEDSTDVLPADTTDADSLAHLYFPTPRREGYTPPLTARRTRPFTIDLGPYWHREAVLDSSEFRYIITEDVAQQDVRVPTDVDLETYREARLRDALQLGFRDLASRRVRRRGRGGFGITIDIPGGNQSVFSGIFGKNEVDLRVNGQADIDLGFDYQRNELQEAATGSGGSVNPDFGQELSLGITGTIGDKLRINVNYDTQNTFDFENQVSLVYEGYDDDIIQRIEAGNVFLQTPSELIRGGQRLFGLRTDLQFGGLGITLVASQQDAESDALNIEGGSQTTEFSLAPYKYEDNAHFFLAYHFRNWWNEGHKDPVNRTLSPGFATLTGIEVWIHDRTVVNTTGAENERVYATALLDLAEPGPGNNIPGAPANGVLAGGDAYLAGLDINAPLPNELLDQYSDDDLNVLRDSSSQVIIEDAFGLQSSDYETAPFRILQENVDYTVDLYSGYLSLTSRLQEDDMLAVSYQYLTADGTPVTVGDFGQGSQGGSSNGDKIILKLLRGRLPIPSNASWALTMRNIYRVGGRSLRADAFDVDVSYKPSGSTPQRTLPGVTIGLQQTLLQTLGLDRLNRDGAAQPDDVFDFREGQTIDAGSGRIIFPVREPFGAYLRSVLNGEIEGLDISFLGTNTEDAIDDFVFDTLYTTTSSSADRISNINNYAIAGSYRSSVQSVYELGFAIVEGSVSVTSGSIELTEGVDYTVNDASGTVEITNPAFLTPGQNLRIDYERNQFASIGSKTLLGLRANYMLGDDLQLGATWMRLSERPLIDKYRIGEEPLNNTIWGVDGRFEAEPRWLTRAIDALPFLQTRAPSRFELKAEFAQLNPGHPQTFAFNQERDALNALSRDFYEDELTGLSFIDDFEGVENVFSLLQPGAWRLAAAPSGSGPEGAMSWTAGTPVTEPLLPSNWRGLFSWYSVLASTYRGDLCSEVDCTTRATRQLGIREIFPDRDPRRGEPETLTTLDLYIDPAQRGPYNYNGEFETTYNANPQTAWGGMVQRLPEGFTDFGGRNNIEFVEFIFSPQGGRNGTEEIAPGAVLHIDLGQVSEDVIPNHRFNNEDGLREVPIEPGNSDVWGRLPDGQTSTTVDYDDATGQTEDLGLDGLRSSLVNPGGTDYETDERTFFSEFLAGLSQGSMEFARANEDPSADDFHHFDDSAYFNSGNRFEGGRATLQERFSRFFPGLELNAFESQQKISDAGTTGNSRQPDSEDLNGNQSLDQAERHFRYTIPLDSAGIRASPFFQNDIVTESGQIWYVIRIPVRSEEREAIGGIEDFSSIEFMRIWSTGHDRPATLRFATLEIVGSRWLKSDNVGIDDRTPGTIPPRIPPRLFIETINNEENPNQYATPVGALVSRTPDISGNLIRQREQALVFRVENLPEETSRAIYKPFSTNSHDLTKYSNLRMFTHAEGFEERDSVRVFIRLGDNQTEDYYEYEQPLYPYVIPDGQLVNPDSLWQTNVPVGTETVDRNSINVVLSELNQLKVERDNDPSIPRDERYSNNRTPEGAPPGTRITIRGNPSIQSINTIAIGVRNAEGGTTAPLENVEVWFNELRVTGYDEESGWSAYARATLQLADVASINARFSRQTDGFGELGSSLGGRSFSDKQDYSVLATFNAHKFLPERFGWSMPISLSIQQSQSTPRYSPRRGDIRVEELIAQAEEDPDLTQEERQDRVDQIIGESETSTFSRSIRIPLSKSGSRSPWLRYTIDGVSLVYTNSASRSRSPFSQFGDTDRWLASFTYRLSVPQARSVRPFWFVENVPVLGILGKLRLNYLPQSFTFSADADRSVTDNRERPIDEVINNPVNQGVPERFLYPTRRDHRFGHGRTFDLAYNPFTFLVLSYRSDVSQSLDGAGAEAGFNLFVRDSLGTTREYNISNEEAFAPGGIARRDFGIPDSLSVNDLRNQGYIIQEITALNVLPLGEVLGGVFNGERQILTNSYSQNVTGTFQPQFDRVQFLRWFRPQPITYGSQFAWNYSQEVDDTIVANVNASSTIRGGLRLQPREFWRLFSFYRNIEQAEQQGNRGRGDDRGRGRDRPTDEGEPTDDEQADDEGQEDAEERRRPRLPSFASIGRKLFLAVTGVEDFTITYNGTRSTAASGLRGNNFSLYDALLGEGPSLGYRLSLERRIPLRDRILSEGLLFHDILGNGHHINARTSIRLTPELRVDLTWDANWDQSEDITLEIENGRLVERPAVERGGGKSTVVAFGGSYERLLEIHRQRYEADAAEGGAAQDTLFSDVLTRSGLAADFQSAFASGMGSFGPRGFFVLPLPNWEINYSGLSRWPLFRALANQVTLRHGYSATYDLSYNSNAAAGTSLSSENIQVPLAGGGIRNQTLISEIPFREPSTAIVNERFQPLLGVNVTWKGGLQTDFSWNQSNSRSLSAASASVSENTTDELSLRLTYSKTGLRIPLFGRRRLNNNVRFSLTLTRSNNINFIHFLKNDLEDILRGLELTPPQDAGSTRLTVEPRLSYAISNQV
ncbi:MAG: cell surface protein SprA, partial [Bacteroidetes bacterium]|nr:cell surface protein SprA [Bacteroidota bacterium]